MLPVLLFSALLQPAFARDPLTLEERQQIQSRNQEDNKRTLVFRTVDPAGQPILTAELLFPLERDQHLVNSEVGTFDEEQLWLKSGDIWFLHGLELQLLAFAPGYDLVNQTLVIGPKKQQFYDIVLTPIPPADSKATALEQTARSRLSNWAEARAKRATAECAAEEKYLACITADAEAREALAEATRDWLEDTWSSTGAIPELGFKLCRMVSFTI
jgi:hypothetical protein